MRQQHESLGQATDDHGHEGRLFAAPLVWHGTEKPICSESDEIRRDHHADLLRRHALKPWHVIHPVVDEVFKVFVWLVLQARSLAYVLSSTTLIVCIPRRQTQELLL